MNLLRITANITLTVLLLIASLHLLFVESFALRSMVFTGWGRYLLAVSLLLMAAFAGAVARGWIRGNIPKPPASSFRFDPTYVHPAYKGRLLVQYWYIVLPALMCLVLAFVLAKVAPSSATPARQAAGPGQWRTILVIETRSQPKPP